MVYVRNARVGDEVQARRTVQERVRSIELSTRQLIWGGGEELLVQLAREFSNRGVEVSIRARRDSAIAERSAEFCRSRSRRPDLVLASDFRTLWTGWLRRPRTRHAFLVHGEWQTSALRNQFLAALGVPAFAVSSSVRTAVLKNGHVSPGKIAVLPLGPDRSRFRPANSTERDEARAKFGISRGSFVACFVGRLQDIKRLELFSQAVQLCDVTGLLATPPARTRGEIGLLQIAGVGPGGHPGLVHLKSADIREVLWASDVLVSTSRSESLGVAQLEALACGRPVVNTALGGPTDFLQDGVNGLSLPGCSDPNEIAKAIARMRDDAHLYSTMSESAPKSIADRSAAACVDLILERVCALPT